MEKKKLLVSFSGGETSAYMAQWLWKNKQDEYEMIFVFANTGQENEQTLQFIQQCDSYFGLNVIWVEAVVNPEFGKGTKAKIVNFNTASRNGEPFEAVIKKYGLPSKDRSYCSRELKLYAIKAYMRSIGWKKYYNAVGIRSDEIDRVSENRVKDRIIYPLVSMAPMTKPKINLFWHNMPFRLRLKGYEGNCKWCFKKSLRKLLTIAKENPSAFDFPTKMEALYENKVAEHINNDKIKFPLRLFWNNLSSKQILEMSNSSFDKAIDDAVPPKYSQIDLFGNELDISNGCSESCEAF